MRTASPIWSRGRVACVVPDDRRPDRARSGVRAGVARRRCRRRRSARRSTSPAPSTTSASTPRAASTGRGGRPSCAVPRTSPRTTARSRRSGPTGSGPILEMPPDRPAIAALDIEMPTRRRTRTTTRCRPAVGHGAVEPGGDAAPPRLRVVHPAEFVEARRLMADLRLAGARPALAPAAADVEGARHARPAAYGARSLRAGGEPFAAPAFHHTGHATAAGSCCCST